MSTYTVDIQRHPSVPNHNTMSGLLQIVRAEKHRPVLSLNRERVASLLLFTIQPHRIPPSEISLPTKDRDARTVKLKGRACIPDKRLRVGFAPVSVHRV